MNEGIRLLPEHSAATVLSVKALCHHPCHAPSPAMGGAIIFPACDGPALRHYYFLRLTSGRQPGIVCFACGRQCISPRIIPHGTPVDVRITYSNHCRPTCLGTLSWIPVLDTLGASRVGQNWLKCSWRRSTLSVCVSVRTSIFGAVNPRRQPSIL